MALMFYKKVLPLLLSVTIIFQPLSSFASESESEEQAPPPVEYKLDLRIAPIEEGELAPFTGILLTTDSLTKMQLEFEKKVEELSAKNTYDMERYQLHLGFLGEKLEQEKIFRRNEIQLRDEYIESLEEKYLEKGDISPWVTAGSFVLGCLTTIAIAYSLESAYK